MRLCVQVADALEHAHRARVVHRDVKPHNIVLDEDGAPHLTDFGLARDAALGTLTKTGEFAGTPYYMSPEQARVDKAADRVDHRTDLYSLGVVLYELLTLHRPFEGRSSMEVVRQIETRRPPSVRALNPRVPQPLETICDKAMRKQARSRYGRSGDFRDDLERFLAGKKPHARPMSLVERLREARQRRPVTNAVLVSTVSTVLVVLLAWFLWSGPTARRLIVDSAPRGARVVAVPLDPIQSLPLDERAIELGVTPLEARVAPGNYRIAIEASGAGTERGFGEAIVYLDDGDGPRELPPVGLRPSADATADMVLVEAGPFEIAGPTEGDFPIQAGTVTLAAFWIDRVEVTNAAYRSFCEATGHPVPDAWPEAWDPAWDELPVAFVSVFNAERYAAWTGKRLPTLWEWERAVRGPTRAAYPWGDEPSDLESIRARARAGVAKSVEDSTELDEWTRYLAGVRPVGTHPEDRGPEGALDGYGNVAEWTASLPFRQVEEGHWVMAPGHRFTAGPGWAFNVEPLSSRGFVANAATSNHVGFRCARSLTLFD